MSAQPQTGRPVAIVILLLLMAAAPRFALAEEAPPAAAENSITVYGGERFGGSLTDSTTNSAINLQSGSSVGLAVDIGLDHATQLEVFFSRQDTALSSGAYSSQNAGLSLYNYHLGGTAFLEEVGRGPYVMGGLGATTARPNASGRNSETFFSGNLGVGWMVPLGRHVGLRLEARGYAILLNNSSTAFCGGAAGCSVAIKGSGLFEGEVLAGLSARF
jgi:hypothetical protein